ncbi:uncharacterized protein LOC119840215 [Zerene cesonia]|uniref:uncharacterized protein LOC119840215 n=1 Tax=Zerene cesonia TaxID=33412 RepID=UPI0018E4DDDD|nr:uncharacterized protein LOC119840215 [Zerene cesonia]
MTLNKQKILSELGSVVNQLQSADCGCMGKLFGNSNQNNNSMGSPFVQQGGYKHSCCHGHGCGYNGVAGGESYSQKTPYSCMGRCNPPKLYADTYNFLNENLMQPVVKEVYHDLKTISPANTIMNNEMGAKLGLGQTQGFNSYNQLPTNQNYTNNIMSTGHIQNQQVMQNPQMMQNSQMPGTAHNQQYLGGMGPQIMNMINGESIVGSPQQQSNQLKEIGAAQSPHGKVGLTPLSVPNYSNCNNSAQLFGKNINPNEQNIYAANVANTTPNMQSVNSMQKANPMQQTQLPQQVSNYGQHNLGMKKFNEMFPGVMQGLGGDLGFDPMSIAIQMNPANQQQAAMNTMQKMMNNNENLGKILTPAPTQPAQNTITQQSPTVPNPVGNPANQVQNNVILDQTQMNNQQSMMASNQPNNQPTTAYQQQPNAIPVYNQQIYQAVANPQMTQQSSLPQTTPHQMFDPNTGAPTTPPILATVREDLVMTHPVTQPQSHLPNQQHFTPQTVKEPIFPVDTTNHKIYHDLNRKNMEPAHYNTLGQPVEKLPGNMYHQPIPSLPQTLSPQPLHTNQAKYSNVKATVSKTSLMGNKPAGQTPSRSQLQQIYNQYKGSQSFTQQSIKAPVEGPSQSDRRLNISKEARQHNVIPIEKTGGDSYANNQPIIQKTDIGHVNGQIGDVIKENKPELAKQDLPSSNRKYRNGLQDIIYTSYPTSAAWSFHGDGQRSNLVGRRHNKYRY